MINRLDIADPLSGLLLLQIVITILTRPNQYVYMDPKTYANLSLTLTLNLTLLTL